MIRECPCKEAKKLELKRNFYIGYILLFEETSIVISRYAFQLFTLFNYKFNLSSLKFRNK